jgi:[glutamine synthetase] adenylyltransferase / [glutamine synthetase]-adenylyl-L-tyrosine phosphorylase
MTNEENEYWLSQMDEDYQNVCSYEDNEKHLALFEEVWDSSKNKESLSISIFKKGDFFELCFLGKDFIGLQSILSGVLFLNNFNILDGNSYSWVNQESFESITKGRFSLNIYTLELAELNSDFNIEQAASILKESYLTWVERYNKRGVSDVRMKMHLQIASKLNAQAKNVGGEIWEPRLLPVHVELDSNEVNTHLGVSGEDTPAFLFTLTNALNIQGILIDKMQIKTTKHNVEDEFWLTTRGNKPIVKKEELDKLRTTVALIKQFSNFLPLASDPDTAIKNFYAFIRQSKHGENDLNLFSGDNPERTMTLMARLFGSGSYLWEQFARLQVNNLLPMLKEITDFKKAPSLARLKLNLVEKVENERGFEAKVAVVNAWKDEELFKVDLRSLVQGSHHFRNFSDEIYRVAELSLSQIFDLCYEETCNKMTLNPLEVNHRNWALLGLGKFGGNELGYASDLEIIVIFKLDGNHPEFNSDFYKRAVQLLRKSYLAKSHGVFELDLRLRPHGDAGPIASNFDRYKEYFSPGGQAHQIEKQAQIRMKMISGDVALGKESTAFRNEILFGDTSPLDKEAFLKTREAQIQKLKKDQLNAKYSEGGLVELEYLIQFLQLENGAKYPELRTQNCLEALELFLGVGILKPKAFEKLHQAYNFHRRLINSLRMVRGNAKDLELPQNGSEEFDFLSRRMGYGMHQSKGQRSSYGFSNDLRRHFSHVNNAFNRYFYPKRTSEDTDPSFADVIVGTLRWEQSCEVMAEYGIKEFKKMELLLNRLYDLTNSQELLLSVLVQLGRFLKDSHNPEQILMQFERFILNSDSDDELIEGLLFNPQHIGILVDVFSQSVFLGDFVSVHPKAFYDVIVNSSLDVKKGTEAYYEELCHTASLALSLDESIERICWYRNREYLRIAIRDFSMGVDLEVVTDEISSLSKSIVDVVYKTIFSFSEEEELGNKQCVIAFGKLGAMELNYSSDIDITFVLTDVNIESDEKTRLQKLNQAFIRALSIPGKNGFLFRIDTNLRPHGRQGALMGTLKHYKNYYESEALGWELQIWLKALPVTGNLEAGQGLIDEILDLTLNPEKKQWIRESMLMMRKRVLEIIEQQGVLFNEVKSGPGGLRSIEFFAQRKVVEEFFDKRNLISGNTLVILRSLNQLGILDDSKHEEYSENYCFLRTIEHRLQLYSMQQEHLIEEDKTIRRRLAIQMGFGDRLGSKPERNFMKAYRTCIIKNHELHIEMFPELTYNDFIPSERELM